ncbi:MAG: hypothetical protein B7Y21_05030 [Hydrogenophilales bacterium 16-61-112]|nr:MAG: hypothetical protein B7Y21_05030 [Hydrogenophilales bacterium 16-61-112]
MKRLLAALLLSSVAAVAHAEISQKFGNLEIHYNALTTDELLPEVAKKNKVGAPTPVPAKLTIYATNLTQQLSNVSMREIKEGTAIYYLGEFRVTPPDTLKFTATVEVAGEPKYEMTFDQKFFK